MFRRSVSLLVLVGMFASQLASIPHAHGLGTADQQREHDSRPHFHFAGVGHSHDHKHCKHGHSHAPSSKQRPETSREPTLADLGDCGHDAKAIFAPSVQTWTPQTVQTAFAWQWVAIAATPTSISDVVLAQVFPFSRPPPEAVLDASDTYLTLRTLRI